MERTEALAAGYEQVIPSEWSVERRLADLIALVESNGYQVLYGDFTRRDGTRHPYALRPSDGKKLLRAALRYFEPLSGQERSDS